MGPARRARLGKHVDHHKYDHGHALILSGGAGRSGAARLAARAALRVGAGLVTLAVPPSAVQENAAQLNAIMLSRFDDAVSVLNILEDDRISSVILGPGMGVNDRSRSVVKAVLNSSGMHRRVVLDADALSCFADDPQELFDLCGQHVVITPHEGEFARLFPDLSEKVRNAKTDAPGLSKIDAARMAAKRSGAIILLKGEATVIAFPNGRASLHSALYHRSAPWLGTAGAGDVLAGMIGGILANPMFAIGLHQAVEAAVWLHVECARSFGPGLIAEDLPEELPKVFRALGL